MKRVISLVLCAALLLSLLVGMAGAEEETTETGMLTHPVSLLGQTWLFGDVTLSFRMDGMDYNLPSTAKVYFDNEKLGTVYYYDGTGNFYWDLGMAYPNQSGNLVVEMDGNQWSFPASTGTAIVGVYTDPTYTDDSYLPWDNAKVIYEANVPVTLYIHTANGTTLNGIGREVLNGGPASIGGSNVLDGNLATMTFEKGGGETVVSLDVTFQAMGETTTKSQNMEITFTDNAGSNPALTTNMPVYSDYFGSRGFALYLGDELVPSNSLDYKVYFSNPLLGTLEQTPSDRDWAEEFPWTWSSNHAVPGQNGEIVVEYDGQVYTTPVSTGHPDLGFYTDPSCSLDSLLTESYREIPYENGAAVDVYVKVNNKDMTLNSVAAGIVEWDAFDNEQVDFSDYLVENNACTVTVNGISGYAMLKIVANYSWDDGTTRDWVMYAGLWGEDSDVLDVVWGNSHEPIPRTRLSQFNGGWGLDIVYLDPADPEAAPDYLTGDTAEVRFDTDGLGDIAPISGDDQCEWNYNLWPLEPGRNGYLVVKYNNREYRLFFSTGFPGLGLYDDFSCDPDSYLVKEPTPEVEYTPGEDVTIYTYTRGYDERYPFVTEDSADPDLITIEELDKGKKYAITFSAPENASGNYYYRFPWDGVGLEVEFVEHDSDTLWAVYGGGPNTMQEASKYRFDLTEMSTGNWDKFDLYYKVGNGTIRKIYPGEGVSVSLVGNNLGRVYQTPNDWNPSQGHWVWDRGDAAPGQSGQIAATINGKTYTCSISTQATRVGLYTDPAGTWQSLLMPEPNLPFVEVPYPENGVLELYLRVDPDFLEQHPTIEVSAPDGVDVVQEDGGAKLTWKLAEEGWGRSWPVTANLRNTETGANHYFDIGILPIKVLQDAVKVTPENEATLHTLPACILTEERDQTYFDTTRNMSHFPKIYTDSNGKNYYLGLVQINGPQAQVMPCISFSYNTTMTIPYAAVIYTEDSDQLVPLKLDEIENEGVRTTLKELCSGVEMTIYPTRVREDYIPRTELPRVTAGDTGWLAGQNYTFTANSGGGYVVVVHGVKAVTETGRKETCAYGFLEMVPTVNRSVFVRDLVEEGEAVTVEVINNYLANHPQMGEKDRLILDFSGICGEKMALTGTIVIPNHLFNVNLSGDWENYTYLYGGVESHAAAGSCLSAFKFFSPADSKDQAYLKDGKTPNYAIYGTTGAVHDKCEFEGYYHAVHIGSDAVHLSFGGMGGIFRNNHIGIYVDYAATNGGSVESRSCEFWHNDIGIYLKENEHFRASFLNLIEATFINNTVDIKNDTGTIWWTPMSFFWHHPSDDKFTTHPSNKENANQWQPVTEGTVDVDGAKGKNKKLDSVIAYPVSVSPAFDAGYFYSNKANVSDVLMSMYPPTKTSMPLNADTGVYTFTFITEEAEQNNASMLAETEKSSGTGVMASLELTDCSVQGLAMLMEAAQEVKLNVAIARVIHPGAVVLTVGQIPEGFAGKLTVPLGTAKDPWFNAKVLCNGEELESSVANGEITFATVEENLVGEVNYEIIQVTDAIGNLLDTEDTYLTEIPVGEFTVQVQTTLESGVAQAMLAAYTADGKMLKVYPVSVDKGYDYAPVTIDNTDGKIAELRVFLLNSLTDGMPLCANLVFKSSK